MQDERKRILKMLEDGTISMGEALTLLEALSKQEFNSQTTEATKEPSTELPTRPRPTEEPKREQTTSSKSESDPFDESSADDFFEDLRKDFMSVGNKFMQFMETAVQRVKSFDFEAPFGKALDFTHEAVVDTGDLDELIIHIDHGKVEIQPAEENQFRAEFAVKAYNAESEEEAYEQFMEKLLFVQDDRKLRVASELKMMQVNLVLHVPKKDYKKLSVRLLNGGFTVEDLAIDELRVKTANGKIEATQLRFDNAELETANGLVRLLKVKGNSLEAETLNGRVYIDGDLADVDAKSLNGNVSVTTTSEEAKRLEAKSISGAVEMYFPSTVGIDGTISSNMGKLDLHLNDVSRIEEQEQFLHRTIRFKKEGQNERMPLFVHGESKTGSVLVRYNTIDM